MRSHQERLEKSLQDRSFELAHCRAEIIHQQETISDLRSQLSQAKEVVWNKENQERDLEIQRLREEIERLERECIYLRGCVERGLASIAGNQIASTGAYTSVPIAPEQGQPIAPRIRSTIEVREPASPRQGVRYESSQTAHDVPVSRASATVGDKTVRDTVFIQVCVF